MKTVIEMAHEVYGEHTFWTGPQLEMLKQFAELVRADEREACAEIADSMDSLQDGAIGRAIRARSNT